MSPSPQRIYATHSADETIQLGVELARNLRAPQWILLIGDLGSGKTVLAKGLISGLGVAAPEDVLSPTFSLIHEYEGEPKVYHIDLYRLDRLSELQTLGLDDIWSEPAIVVVEWGEKFQDQLPCPRLEIRIADRGGDHREIHISQSR